MIPKIIHYCWFGGNPLPPLAKKCIKSWKKYCPGYKIIEWNESNFDISSAPLYVQQAYAAKKWAFVTDYVRLFAMTSFGGIYMDTDVEVVASLDPFLSNHAFSGFEDKVHIPTGIMACEQGFPLFVEFLKYYENAAFYDAEGNMNLTTNVIIMTNICLQKGLKQDNSFQIIDGFTIYPKNVFCPLDHGVKNEKIPKETVTIHWFAGSWLAEEKRKSLKRSRNKARRKAQRRMLLDWIVHLPNRITKALLGTERYNKLKKAIKR